MADAIKLTEDQRTQQLPSGQQAVYRNRVGWAHDRLKRAGLSTRLKRGFWRLTESGHAFANANPPPLSSAQVEALALITTVPTGLASSASEVVGVDGAPKHPVSPPPVDNESPDDRLARCGRSTTPSPRNCST